MSAQHEKGTVAARIGFPEWLQMLLRDDTALFAMVGMTSLVCLAWGAVDSLNRGFWVGGVSARTRTDGEAESSLGYMLAVLSQLKSVHSFRCPQGYRMSK